MRIGIVVIVAAWSSSAIADDKVYKAGDYELVNSGYKLDVRKGKVVVPLSPDHSVESFAVDLKKRRVDITYTQFCAFEPAPESWTFDQLEARFANTAALQKHVAKKWKEAATGFATAVKLDPKWRIPAYNLASAQNLLKDTPAAIAALAPWIASEPARTYGQIASDPELVSLLAAPEIAALRATAPGTVTVKSLGAGVAVSVERNLIAYALPFSDMTSCGNTVTVKFHDLKTGALATSLASSDFSDYADMQCTPSGAPSKGDTKKIADRLAKRALPIDKLFADLGFVAMPITESAKLDLYADKPKASLAKSKIYVVVGKSGTNVMRGTTQIGVGVSAPSSVDYVEPANVMLFRTHNQNEGGCPNYGSEVVPLKPAPATPATPAKP